MSYGGLMGIQSFKDLDVWQVAINLVEHCYRVTRDFPKDELYGLTPQIRRASVSIPANIAEGYGREQTGSFVQFLRTAQGSTRELETHLTIAKRLTMISDDTSLQLQSECERISKMLRALIRSLEQRKDQQH
jgi:four helix bundle protein